MQPKGRQFVGAQRKINKAGLLIEACNLIDQMKIAEQNQDVQGDISAGSGRAIGTVLGSRL